MPSDAAVTSLRTSAMGGTSSVLAEHGFMDRDGAFEYAHLVISRGKHVRDGSPIASP